MQEFTLNRQPLDGTWELTSTLPDACACPAELTPTSIWIPARAPGTVAMALQAVGQFDIENPREIDDHDWWFRTMLKGNGRHRITFGGLATIADVWLDDTPILTSRNMYLSHDVDVDLTGAQMLFICCRAFAPALAAPGKRARWRTRMVTPQSLRFHRTTFLGRMNGWCPPVHVAGPWRSVSITPLDRRAAIVTKDIRATCDGSRGIVDVVLNVEGDCPSPILFTCGDTSITLIEAPTGRHTGRLVIENVCRWWPHTHGDPRLYKMKANIGPDLIDLGNTGFRTISIDRDLDGDGFAFVVNDTKIFCRGACWTTADLVALPESRAACEPLLRLMREGNMNMVRVGGTMIYESDAFYEVCDELGLLVWQDFMFSNFDYPASDPDFLNLVSSEAGQFVRRTRASPSLALFCAGSEVAQQAAMMGLPPAAWSSKLFDEVLAGIVAQERPDSLYVPHTPFGGVMPFEPAKGVCHYYGVSAYMRPVDDARHANVRFAAECLGFANLPDWDVPLEADRAAVAQPLWGERYEHDVGALWFFEDVRNHYLREFYEVDPATLRREDPARYLDLSRAVNAELMESVFALWRRVGSPTHGGLVWFLRDVVPGAGWGVIDAGGQPKSVWYALRRAFRNIQVVLVDEGLNGLDIHLINETVDARNVTISVVCLRDGTLPVMRGEQKIQLAPRGALKISSAEIWGAFFDTNHAYRFGPPSHHVVIAQLRDADGAILSEAFHFPLGRGHEQHELDLSCALEQDSDGYFLRISCARFAQSVHIEDVHWRPHDNWFHLAPDHQRHIRMFARSAGSGAPKGVLRAINGMAPVAYGDAP